jgi:hypothetical protein
MDRAVIDLPRSVHLALWLPHVRTAASVAQALAVVHDDDEPHAVVGDAAVPGPGLEDLLRAWGSDLRAVTAALPAPGDVVGVPAAVSAAAVDAGECVLVSTPIGSFAAVPAVEEFGSAAEPGHLVTWHVSEVPPWALAVVGAVGTLAEAEQELRGALLTATDALDALGTAQWRPEAAEALDVLRAMPWHLPPALDPRRARVLSLAARLRVIVDLATTDDGGAVNVWQSDQRTAALRHVGHAARRAICAATLVT